MKRRQLSKNIDQKFDQEQENVTDNSKSEKQNGRILIIIISAIMSVLVIGSLTYSLIEALN